MLEVGLTGGIACGKSVVRRHFQTHGIPTLDADDVVHGLFEPGTDVTTDVENAFGREVIAPSGAVDRRILGSVVFGDVKKRERLEAIVHPWVFQAIEAFFRDARGAGSDIAVVDAALMFETGSYERYDRVVVAYCPKDVQSRRLMDRDGLTREQAERRIASQMPVEEKRDRADHVIDTSGTLEETLRRADAVLASLRQEARERG